jgi:hypothetical protein
MSEEYSHQRIKEDITMAVNEIISEFEVPFPEASPHKLKISLGACRVKATPDDQTYWLSGTYTHPSEDTLPLKIQQIGGDIHLRQEVKLAGLPNLLGNTILMDLHLGKAQPFALELEGGALEGDFDLGGLPLTDLDLDQGAGKFTFNFSAPNPQPMQRLDVDMGAASLEMRNLANANFAEMQLDGGAASFRLHFGGTLQREANVKLSAGASSVVLQIPATTAAKIYGDAKLGSMEVGDGFMKREGAFWNEAAIQGQGPVLTIHVSVALGSLQVKRI